MEKDTIFSWDRRYIKWGEWFKKRDSVQTFNKEDYIGAASLVT